MSYYSKSTVEAAIKSDKRIKGKEAKMIHALLKGRQTTDEPPEPSTEAARLLKKDGDGGGYN